MINLDYKMIYQYNELEINHLKELKKKYGKKYQNTYGTANKRVWYDGETKSISIKHEIIKSVLFGSKFRCAYCSKRLIRSEKPIDHFIPNSIHPIYSFHGLNLIPSCGYCNSTLKKAFDPLVISNKKYRKNKFFIVHPLIDNVDDHIFYDENNNTELDFSRCTIEGLNSIELFKLYTFEMNQERINQKIIEMHNPLTELNLLKLVNECATYNPKK